MENGPSIEKDIDLPDGVVYCVDCGTVFVHDIRRSCPSCHNDEQVSRIQEAED